MKITTLLLTLIISTSAIAQEEISILKTTTGNIEGTLLLPEQKTGIPVVLIIAGSGPTDRNGNQEEGTNNSLKFLAQEFQKKGIASLRYDKRGVAQSSDVSNKDEMELRVETYSDDVKSWIDLLEKDKRFNKIIVAGHSEGSLMGMIASSKNPKVSGFISISGAGRPIDEILKDQLSTVPDNIKTTMYSMIDRLKKGDTLENVPPIFYALFRPSIQPYMKSWMKYNPQNEIQKLKMPILIINGTTDLQVKVIDAELLAKAQPKAELKIIKNMNHVLKDCETTDKDLQKPIYDNADLPLNKEFCEEITGFVLNKVMNTPAPIKVKN